MMRFYGDKERQMERQKPITEFPPELKRKKRKPEAKKARKEKKLED